MSIVPPTAAPYVITAQDWKQGLAYAHLSHGAAFTTLAEYAAADVDDVRWSRSLPAEVADDQPLVVRDTTACPSWCEYDIDGEKSTIHVGDGLTTRATGDPSHPSHITVSLERLDKADEQGQPVITVGERMLTLVEALEHAATVRRLAYAALRDWAGPATEAEIRLVAGHSEPAAIAAVLAEVDPEHAIDRAQQAKRRNAGPGPRIAKAHEPGS